MKENVDLSQKSNDHQFAQKKAFKKCIQLTSYLSPFLGLVSYSLLRKYGHNLKSIYSRDSTKTILFSVGGLLSSSCCLIQLLINCLSLGCAGFSRLDPYRPIFLFSTFGAMTVRSLTEYKAGVRKARPILWLLTLLLAFSPQLLRMKNQEHIYSGYKRKSISSSQEATNSDQDDEEHLSEATTDIASSSADYSDVDYCFTIKGIRCEACAHAFKRSIECELKKTAIEATLVSIIWKSSDESTVRILVNNKTMTKSKEAQLMGDQVCAGLEKICSLNKSNLSIINRLQ
jgi:hypothetical protein